jgi:hypothetical protein
MKKKKINKKELHKIIETTLTPEAIAVLGLVIASMGYRILLDHSYFKKSK